RIWTAADAQHAIALGASFVVVGTAITNPMAITARFTQALRAATPLRPTDREVFA
nr:hypothetical protein [Chloroflexia bacterium]